MESGPGQAPGMKVPLQLSDEPLFRQVPLPELVLQVILTQHWTLSGPGQNPASWKPEVVQSDVYWHVPLPSPSVEQDCPMGFSARGRGTRAAESKTTERKRRTWRVYMAINEVKRIKNLSQLK